MIRQMAVTTATNVADMGKYLLDRGIVANGNFLYKVLLPVNERKLVMHELNLMGINSMTLFPDFDGVCASMKEVFFNNLDVQPFIPLPPPLPKAHNN